MEIVPFICNDPHTAEDAPVLALHVVLLAWPPSSTYVPSADTTIFVPLSFDTVTPAVSTRISLQEVPLALPPQPANENTGLTTGWLKVRDIRPRPPQISLAKQPSFDVVIFSPGSVTRPVATNMPAAPPRSCSDSVTS